MREKPSWGITSSVIGASCISTLVLSMLFLQGELHPIGEILDALSYLGHIVGFISGAVGLFLKSERKRLAILGLTLNSWPLFALGMLLLLGGIPMGLPM